MSNSGSRGWKLVIFNIFNVLFLFVGTVNFVAFFYEWQLGIQYIKLFSSKTFIATLYSVLTCSCLILCASTLGVVSTIAKKSIILFLCLFVLILIILLELVILTTSYIYSTNLPDILQNEFNQTFLIDYGFSVETTDSVDFIQQNEGCCGIYSFFDWNSSNWREVLDAVNFVPLSCCRSMADNCGTRIHPSNIYYEGCLELTKEKIDHFLRVLLYVSLGSFAVPIIGIVLGIMVYVEFIKRKESSDGPLLATLK